MTTDAERHKPDCDTQLGPKFEVRDGVVYMTIFACLGCADEEADQ